MLPGYATDEAFEQLLNNYIRIIPAKFGQIPASSRDGDVLEAIVDGARHPTITIHHLEALTQVSLKAYLSPSSIDK